MDARYRETGLPEHRQAMIDAYDAMIALQKEWMIQFKRARQSLQQLEDAVGELPDEIFYRKAVLTFEEDNYQQAEILL